MRIVFAGTPEVAVPTLEALVSAGHEIAAVLTREDAPVGRRRVLTPSPVAQRAEELGLTVVRANRITDEIAHQLLATEFELGVVVAYGGLIRTPLLDTPKYGWINLHFSQLPRWRGAAPVQRAVMAGDATSGVAVFQLEAGLDTGPTYVNRAVEIGAHETAGDLLNRLAQLGAPEVTATVASIADGSARAEPQSGEATTAPKLTNADGRVDWTETSETIDARVRGVTPEPGAATELAGQRVKLLRGRASEAYASGEPGTVTAVDGLVLVATGAGAYQLLEVQPAGKRPMAAADWFRGQHGEVRFA
ncbi:methionyl-tRNA formyltransferase [Gulosibacter faecalis]|uniref:Methionyl-tRNA formyltransferase n=1 Tax=Gulosibacter faecalis TaxID=272240 RepID=A0ABW5UZF0_9MICO|nr:methionyl-tRNA formyltransferase [Gulosibacter faecalis]